MKKFSNLFRLYRKIWKLNMSYILGLITMIILYAVHPLNAFYFLYQIIYNIESNFSIWDIMQNLSVMFAIEMFYYIFFWQFSKYEKRKIVEIKNEFIFELQQKTMNISFQKLEDPNMALAQQKALEVFYPRQAEYMDLQVTLNCMRILLSTGIQLIVLGILLIFVDWKLIFFLVLFSGISIWLKTIAIDRKFEIWDKKLVQIGRQAAYYQELATNFSYAKEVRLYSLSDWITDKIHGITKMYIGGINKSVRDFSIVGMISSILMGAGTAVAFIQLGYLTWTDKLPTAGFVSYINVIRSFESSLLLFIEMYMVIGQAATYMGTYWEYIDRIEAPKKEELIKKTMENAGQICFENVWFKYPGAKEYTLRDISFKISAGEKVALVGENGSGKTTLIKLLLRLYEPERGAIYWNGQDISTIKYDEYMECVTAVFQDFKILEDTVENNILFGKTNSGNIVKNVLNEVGMAKKIYSLTQGSDSYLGKTMYENGMELSGGEKQKLAIARVLARNADMVIMDEPTAMLSPKVEFEIYTNFANLVKERSAIYISHRMSSCRFCDWIMVLKNGSIQEKGTHDELMESNGEYHKMYAAQAAFYEELA